MMKIIVPSIGERKRIQSRESGFYWSACLDGFLRKHGLINAGVTEETHGHENDLSLICRGVGWNDRAGPAAIVEGPLSNATASQLGLVVQDHETQEAIVTDGDGYLESLTYPIGQTRPRINYTIGAPADPVPFQTDDPRWTNRTIRYQTFSVHPGWQTLLQIQTADKAWQPVCLRRGTTVLLGFPYFDLVCSGMAFPPLRDGYWTMVAGPPTPSAELWLVKLIVTLAREAQITVVRVSQWPDGFDWALTVRHDWDRRVNLLQLWRLLRFYRKLRIWASFGVIRAGTVTPPHVSNRRKSEDLSPPDHINMVVRYGHEINLHSFAQTLAEFKDTHSRLSTMSGRNVVGYHCHGGVGGLGYRGDVQFEWAERVGLRYAEMLGRSPYLPVIVARLRDGVPALSRLVAPATHGSIDAGMKHDMHYLESLTQTALKVRSLGGHMVVMNHPDIHIKQLKKLLYELPKDRCWRATLADVCFWFETTKIRSSVSRESDRYVIEFPAPLPHACRIDILSGEQAVSIVADAGVSSVDVAISEPVARSA